LEAAEGAETAVVNLVTLLVGPLAGPECRRALARGWLIVVRVLAASAVLVVTLIALWLWWISSSFDAQYQPFEEVRVGLALVEGMLLVLALVLGPALLAGSLAGDRERGSLALLLTTRVSAREVVSGRMAGKLAQLGMIGLAGVPAVVMMAALAGMGWRTIAVLLVLPAAVGFGGGGLAAVSSVVSRRGRDALLAVYMVDLFLLLAPLSSYLGLPRGAFDWVAAFNPFISLGPLVWEEALAGALTSSGIWLLIGLAGAAVASARLRASCLAAADGERAARRGLRRGYVPEVDENRPMLWKELFIEHVATLGRFGRWAGRLLVGGLVLVSVGLTGVIVWDALYVGGHEWAEWATGQLAAWVGQTGGLLCCLIQWAIGLRAAVSISSERERGTWDALLTSPLDARQIVGGKLYGSFYALRGLILAALLAWTLAAASGAIQVRDAVTWACSIVFVGAFMAAVGVRTSLACATATRAMSLTIGTWLGAYVAVVVTAGVIILAGLFVCNAALIALAQIGVVPTVTALWIPLPAYIAWPLTMNALFLAATLLIVADTRLRFDRIAGRLTEGAASLAVDQFLYGRPEEPVLADAGDDVPASPDGGWREPEPANDQERGEAVAGSA
jgi:ABC-type transport system involved in multi-copper enzyme maturation permease subunit